MKVVVTGGAGFIGSNLGRELLTLSDVDEVVALDDLSTGSRANLDGTGIRLLEGRTPTPTRSTPPARARMPWCTSQRSPPSPAR